MEVSRDIYGLSFKVAGRENSKVPFMTKKIKQCLAENIHSYSHNLFL